MHAYIINGGSYETRSQSIDTYIKNWKINSFDIISLQPEGTSIGIERVRSLQQKFTLKPLNSPMVLAIIRDAQTLTTEAQNALLKILEEPPAHGKIILETENELMLLPTILSRCMIIQATHDDTPSGNSLLDTLTQLSGSKPGQQFLAADQYTSTKETLATFFAQLLKECHEAFTQQTKKNTWPTVSRIVRNVQLSEKYLKANVSYRAVADMFFLSL